MQREIIKIKYKLKIFSHYFQKQHLINQVSLSNFPVESPSCHNGFSLDLEDKTKHGVATNLFCLGVIGHRKCLTFYIN